MNYRVAIIGAGGIAAAHLEAIQEIGQLTACAIADIRQERAEELASTYAITPYTDYRQMLEMEKPDLAAITLPHYLHKEAAVFAAANGCHMLLEKPMALNTAECDEIIRAVEAAGVKLMVGHTHHYTAENIAAKQWIDSGKLGRLVLINDRRHQRYDMPWRPDWFFEKEKAGGGILMNLGSHSIDKIQWLSGGTVTKVKASVDYGPMKGNIEGGGAAYLDTSSGIPAIMSQCGYPGAIVDETELLFTHGSMKLQSGIGLWVSTGGEYEAAENVPAVKPFVLQFEDLIRAIEEDREPECSMAYSRSVVAAVEALYRSSQSGREVILSDLSMQGGTDRDGL